VPEIIAETDEILAVNKPAGLIAHSDGRTTEPSLAEWIAKEYPALRGVGGAWVSPQGERVQLNGIVHRLDRTTSGVIIVAKKEEIFAYLKNEFKERRVAKTYRAFVHGHMESNAGKIVAEIMRSSEPPRRWFARSCEETDKRAAITLWRLLKKFEADTGEPVSYVEAEPKTGRTHQIRVHFASVGHPLVGDTLYNGGRPPLLGFTRPALHAYSISLIINNKKETFTAPLPEYFAI
jgi:23S rRNA pseudouridine1911/1915/1917 synthase